MYKIEGKNKLSIALDGIVTYLFQWCYCYSKKTKPYRTFFGKIVKIEFKNISNTLFSQESMMLWLLGNKMMFDFYITKINGINQRFTYKQKYDL